MSFIEPFSMEGLVLAPPDWTMLSIAPHARHHARCNCVNMPGIMLGIMLVMMQAVSKLIY